MLDQSARWLISDHKVSVIGSIPASRCEAFFNHFQPIWYYTTCDYNSDHLIYLLRSGRDSAYSTNEVAKHTVTNNDIFVKLSVPRHGRESSITY